MIAGLVGPEVLRDAFSSYTQEAGELQSGWAGEWELGDSNFRVYPMGQWYEPCKWDDYQCHARVTAANHREPQLVGHHINAGAWLKALRMDNRRAFIKWLPVLALSAGVLVSFIIWVLLRKKQTWLHKHADISVSIT